MVHPAMIPSNVLISRLFAIIFKILVTHKPITFVDKYLTIILRNRAEYHLILSRRGRRPSWLNQGIFRKIEQDNCFIIQQIPIAYHFQNEKNYGSMIKTLKASNT